MPVGGGGVEEVANWSEFEYLYNYSGDDFGEYQDEVVEAFNQLASDPDF